MSNPIDLSDPLKKERAYSHFRLVLKKVRILDQYGVKWIPYKYEYTGKYDTYIATLLLTDYNITISVRIKTPQFDDGQIRYLESSMFWNDLHRGNSYRSMTRLFSDVKARCERNDWTRD